MEGCICSSPLNEVLLDGIPLRISKEYKRAFAGLVEDFIFRLHGAYGELIDGDDIANPIHNEVNPVKIRFNNGIPAGQNATAKRSKQYLERKDKAAHLESDGDLGFNIEE